MFSAERWWRHRRVLQIKRNFEQIEPYSWNLLPLHGQMKEFLIYDVKKGILFSSKAQKCLLRINLILVTSLDDKNQ